MPRKEKAKNIKNKKAPQITPGKERIKTKKKKKQPKKKQ